MTSIKKMELRLLTYSFFTQTILYFRH